MSDIVWLVLRGTCCYQSGRCTKLTTGEAFPAKVPLVAEHDTWISVDPVLGCPANCSYCYLGPMGLKASRPSQRIPPRQAVARLRDYLADTRDDLADDADSTPVCLGNHTDMLMTSANRDYLRRFAGELADAGITRPLVVVSKGRMTRPLAEALDSLDLAIVVFHSQSFHRTTFAARTEKGPVLDPDQTFDACAVYRGLKNITPVHFWRPITRRSVPSSDWAAEMLARLKAAGYRCSVAIGLAVGPGIEQRELVETRILERAHDVRGEMWDDGVWADISAAAVAAVYPVYRSTSCAIGLATGKPEALGVWDRRRGAGERCLPCNCPETQRSACRPEIVDSEGLGRPLSWIAARLARSVSEFEVLPGRRVRVRGEVPQSMISLALHKYRIELLPEVISAERAWLGVFGRGGGMGSGDDEH